MEIADSARRAEWAFQTCCEIWEIQGRAQSRPFFRAIFDSCLQPLFSVREGTFTSGLELLQMRTGRVGAQGIPTIVGHLKREMGRLRSKWSTKLEIAARDNEHKQKRHDQERLKQRTTSALPPLVRAADDLTQGRAEALEAAIEVARHPGGESLSPEQVRTTALSFDWKELESRFSQIQAKPAAQERVTADFTRTEWESGSVSEEWSLSGNRVGKAEFERFAVVAARKLGFSARDGAVEYWLKLVREWLRTTGLDKDNDLTWRPTGQGHHQGKYFKDIHLSTKRIAEISAWFCIESLSRGAPECTVLPPSQETAIADKKARAISVKTGPKKNQKHLQKTAVIYGAIQSGLKALQYCKLLDERNIRLPNGWTEEGCPSSYTHAYNVPGWRKRIQDEKCRFRRQYENTSIREREALIQGANTRGTRR